MKGKENPEIGLMITPAGVRGVAVFGATIEVRQRSLAFFDILEPDLIEIQELLNARIASLKKGPQILEET